MFRRRQAVTAPLQPLWSRSGLLGEPGLRQAGAEGSAQSRPLLELGAEGAGAGAPSVRSVGEELLREVQAIRTDAPSDVYLNVGDIPSMPLAQDAFAVGIMCIVQGFDTHARAGSFVARSKSVVVVCFGVGLLLLDCCMQLFLMLYMRRFVLHSLAVRMRQIYHEFHETVFIGGIFSVAHWNTWDEASRQTLCQYPLSTPLFFSTVLLLWTYVIGGDLREVTRLTWDISVLPDADESQDLARCGDGRHVIVRMRRCPRLCICLLALLPKYILGAMLWLYGSRWLMSTPSFSDLILNSCALGFILHLGGIIYSATMPLSLRQQLERTSIYAPRLSPSMLKNHWQGTRSATLSLLITMFYAASGFVAVLLYVFRFQRVLPTWNWDVHEELCAAYVSDSCIKCL